MNSAEMLMGISGVEMDKYKYLIIGGGMTAMAAIRGIREVDPHGSIALVGLEPDLHINVLRSARGYGRASRWRAFG